MMSHNNIPLDQLSNSMISTRLFEYISTWLQDELICDLQFNGTQQQINVLKDVMLASKKFHHEVLRHDAKLSLISESLDLKHIAALRFQKTFGIVWPF